MIWEVGGEIRRLPASIETPALETYREQDQLKTELHANHALSHKYYRYSKLASSVTLTKRQVFPQEKKDVSCKKSALNYNGKES